MATKSAPPPTNSNAKTATGRARPKTGSRSTRRSARQATSPTDAISLLKQDHREVKQWFQEFDRTDDDAKKQDLANRICRALTVHATIEEELFYPAAYDALDQEGDDLLDEAVVEHAGAKALIAEIEAMAVGEPLFDAKVKVLGEYIDHHVKEEETELFPECRDTEMDLKALGKALSERKQQLMAS